MPKHPRPSPRDRIAKWRAQGVPIDLIAERVATGFMQNNKLTEDDLQLTLPEREAVRRFVARVAQCRALKCFDDAAAAASRRQAAADRELEAARHDRLVAQSVGRKRGLYGLTFAAGKQRTYPTAEFLRAWQEDREVVLRNGLRLVWTGYRRLVEVVIDPPAIVGSTQH
jgi:hypothetical protein